MHAALCGCVLCVRVLMSMCRRAHMCVLAHARHAQATQQHAAPHLRLETSRYALLGLLSSCPRKVAQVVPVYVGTHSAGHVRARDSILANDGSARGLAGRAADCGVHKDMQHEEGGISGMAISTRGIWHLVAVGGAGSTTQPAQSPRTARGPRWVSCCKDTPKIREGRGYLGARA